MIVITDIKTVTVDEGTFYRKLVDYPDLRVPFREEQFPHDTVLITTEEIRGRRYRFRSGKEVVIGVSKDVYGVLGISLEEIENLYTENEKLQTQNNALTSSLYKYKTMNWVARLRFLFKK